MNNGWSIFYAVRKLVATQFPLILLITVLGLVSGLAYGLKEPTSYTARATIVTGTYSLPSDIGIQGVIDKTGPLALELPAETQAIIISAPVITNAAALGLGLDPGQARALADSVRAKPATDNSFAITADGPTPEKAANYANAVARAYLEYRGQSGKSSMENLAGQYKEQADSAAAAAKALDTRIAAAGGANSGPGAALVARQQELLKQSEQSRTTSGSLTSMATDFNGGGALLEEASAEKASKSLGLPVYAALGLAAGLGLGVVVAAARRQISPRITDRVDVTQTLEGLPVFAEQSGKDPVLGSLLWRSILHSTQGGEQPFPASIAIQAISQKSSGRRTALALAEAVRASGHQVRVFNRADVPADEHPVAGQVQILINRPVLDDAAGQAPWSPDCSAPMVLAIADGKDKADVLYDVADQIRLAGSQIVAATLTKPEKRRARRSHGKRGKGAEAPASESGPTGQAPGEASAKDAASPPDESAQDQFQTGKNDELDGSNALIRAR